MFICDPLAYHSEAEGAGGANGVLPEAQRLIEQLRGGAPSDTFKVFFDSTSQTSAPCQAHCLVSGFLPKPAGQVALIRRAGISDLMKLESYALLTRHKQMQLHTQ